MDSREDYEFLVQLFVDRVTAFALVFAYAIIPNHFHLSIRLLPEEALREVLLLKEEKDLKVKERKWLSGRIPYRQLIGDYWATIFAIYANYFNPREGRRGTLLDQTLRRIRVRDDLVSRSLIMYIHTNEVKHRLLRSYMASGPRTSFAYYSLQRDDHWLARDIVLARFGGLAAFYRRHEAYVRKYGHRIAAFDEELYFQPLRTDATEAPHVPFLDDEA